MEDIIRGVWLMEIDTAAGKEALKAAFRKFKGADAVRLTTSNHLMWRIFWHHWQMASRTSFAEMARAILAPLGLISTDSHKNKMLAGHRS